jgi:hypothetical protein
MQSKNLTKNLQFYDSGYTKLAREVISKGECGWADRQGCSQPREKESCAGFVKQKWRKKIQAFT